MRYSRSFLKLLLITILLFLSSRAILAIDIPRLTLQKTFFKTDEPISILYEGAPTPLEAQIIDHNENKVEYKAVLHTRENQNYLDFETADPLPAGKYSLKVWKDNDKLIDSVVYSGVEEPASPTPSKADEVKDYINRVSPSLIEAGKTYQINLSFTARQDFKGTIKDRVPFDAIVDATGAAEIKKPELLSLGMPFENDYEVTAPFGQVNPAEHLGIRMHDGVDFATPVGTPIFAVDDGEIVPYHEDNHYGDTQAVHHSWGTTFYGHLSTVSAKIGDKVKKGQKIGISGNTGLSTGPHLHFGMKWGDTFVNGLPYIKTKNMIPNDQKEISWDIDVKKGEKVTKTYSFTLPPESTSSASFKMGPAASSDILEKIHIEEEKPWNLSLRSATDFAITARP